MNYFSNFVWWQGVVEDVDDPLKLGRCRVRIVGFHTDIKSDLPTSHLPWAQPIQPITSAAISGIGISPTGILPGTWVFGFFRDGDKGQLPVIFGTLAGIPIQESRPSKGFNDPSGVYPLSAHLNESDVNRLARNENIENTIVATKKENTESNVVSALGEEWWEEPETPYNAQYPKNKVLATESGHVEEFDDTPGAERIHRYHKSGTFEEIHPDGTKITKVVKNNYSIIAENNKILIKGTSSTNIEETSNTKISQDCNVHVEGNVKLYIKGNITLECDGNVNQKVNGTYTVVSDGNMTFLAPRIDLNPNGFSSGDVSDPISPNITEYDSQGNPK
jgi:hypothetical protein